jgi:hypothetical protein
LKKLIRKICILVLILLLVIIPSGRVFIYKTGHRGSLQDGLYLSNDRYDVVMIGGSHMNGGLDPNVLWKRQGISSYNYATGGQPIDVNYYLLKEVLKKQKSPLVVLDTFYLGMTAEYGETGFVSNVLDNVNLSRNKLDAIWNCVPPDERLFYLLPMLKYHFRWSSLTARDFTYDSTSVYYAKGFEAGTSRYGKPISSWEKTEKRAAIPAKPLDYLNKIVALCKENGCQLLLVNFPCDYSEPNTQDGWVDDCEALFNTVADYASEHDGVAFLDLYDKADDIGLDFANDMNNAGHLNIWGACKVSSYFADYLKQHYTLPDHRSDSAYARWNEDYKKSQAAAVS